MDSSPQPDRLDLAQLARGLRLAARGSRLLLLEEQDPALLRRLEQLWEVEDCYTGERAEQAAPRRPTEAPKSRRLKPQKAPEPDPKPEQPAPSEPKAPAPERAQKPSPPPVLEPLVAKSLDSLHFRVSQCERCDLSENRRLVVFGQGNQKGFLMVLGDQPGPEDDPRGLAFSGPDGELLEKILLSLGLSRDSAYLSQAVKCRPGGDRPYAPEEGAACAPILGKQLELLAPKVILALGERAFKALLPSSEPWAALKGRPQNRGEALVFGIEHPRDLLAHKGLIEPLWADLRRFRQALRGVVDL